MSALPRLSTDRDKTRRKSCHRSNNSGEIDSYFSSINERLGQNGPTLMHQLGMLAIRDDYNTRNRQQDWREGRVSLDIPSMKYTASSHNYHHHHYHRQHSVSHPQDTVSSVAKDDVKKHRQQPSSPGGKLASFFNSLISQALSKKKKLPKSSSSSQHIQSSVANNKENIPSQQESPNYIWRKLRSSSNFTTSTTFTKSRTTINTINSSSYSPPYPIKTPTKLSYKNLFSKTRCKSIVIPSTKPDSATQVSADLEWLDEKLKCIKQQSKSSHKERSLIGRNSSAETTVIRRFKEEEEDGGESDSSSDLFELQLNYDQCSSGLPVYETTCVNTINRSIV